MSIPLKSKSKFNKENKDNEFKLTFDNIYHQFISKTNNDIFDGLIRSEFRTKASKLPEEAMKEKFRMLKSRPKEIETNNLNVVAADPFSILNYEIKTPIQEKIVQHSKWMPYYGNYAYCCSCGAGKTLAGIYLIHAFQCRTLIISSRNAVNDQWFSLLINLYPMLIIQTKNGWYREGQKLKKKEVEKMNNEGFEPDIMIFSPQYLAKYVDNYKLTASLIIYDEVHALLSDEFIKVLLLPLYKVINGEMNELPYMIALSATYPSESTKEGKESLIRLNKLFGSVFRIDSEVRKIPVNVWDYRDHFERLNTLTGETMKGIDALGKFDSGYIPLDDCEAIDYFCQKIIDERKIRICKEFKGIIMSYSIDSSAYAAIHAVKMFNCPVVLVRTAEESCFYFEPPMIEHFIYDHELTLDDLIKKGIGRKIDDYKEVVDNCSIIVGTIQRLKEGFSVENIVWGICTKFVFSTIARIQILGRIRRNSKNEELNNRERVFYVCSGCVPTTIGIPNYRGKHRITYDIRGENELFRMENYKRL